MEYADKIIMLHPVVDNDDVRIIPFCVPLLEKSSFGIVGTVTVRGRSAVVWFGWGSIEEIIDDDDDDDGVGISSAVGCGMPSMGPLSLSMPPATSSTMRRGGTSASTVSSTLLLGGTSEDDMILGRRASERLARLVGWPIYVSCSICAGGAGMSSMASSSSAAAAGYEYDDITGQMRAAAMAEKEASRILLLERERLSSFSCLGGN
ncbi:hypothetical protein ACHAXA_008611 [Cyclostephanos tholiformis]|uniref:Uncharacterized protein n=1 Tax=Cyclostephanos tholiformis TaxID=382380 RepID=A0ABD3SPK2_9STRA